MKKDIENKEDVKLLVNTFYDKVNKDELLSPVFNHIAKVDWDAHLPKMYQFWNSILLDTNEYRGKPFDKHAEQKEHIHAQHFERWLALFSETLNELFEGEKATLAIQRANNIGNIFQYKLEVLRGDEQDPKRVL